MTEPDAKRNETRGKYECNWYYFRNLPNEEMKPVLKSVLEEAKK